MRPPFPSIGGRNRFLSSSFYFAIGNRTRCTTAGGAKRLSWSAKEAAAGVSFSPIDGNSIVHYRVVGGPSLPLTTQGIVRESRMWKEGEANNADSDDATLVAGGEG